MNPIFIIGAGRSGTNILRDTLTSFEDLVTWPCDEIDLVFRYGNRNLPDDRFVGAEANPKSTRYIRKFFDNFNRKNSDKIIVEKTCANSLRVPFLNTIFPNARYIFIVRNGFDVIESARKRWTSNVELGYLLKKFQYVPIVNVPYYSMKFLRNRLDQFRSDGDQLSKWGPIYPGMTKDVGIDDLETVCAKQWKHCVEYAYRDIEENVMDRSVTLTYEKLVSDPVGSVSRLRDFLGTVWTKKEIEESTRSIHDRGIGKGQSLRKRDNISSIINPAMKDVYDRISANQ